MKGRKVFTRAIKKWNGKFFVDNFWFCFVISKTMFFPGIVMVSGMSRIMETLLPAIFFYVS
jgi:hypothetical protein